MASRRSDRAERAFRETFVDFSQRHGLEKSKALAAAPAAANGQWLLSAKGGRGELRSSEIE